MRPSRFVAVMALGCLLMTGCRRKPALVIVPTMPPPVMISVPPPTHRTEAFALAPLEETPNPELQLPRRSLPRFRPLRATKGQLAALKPPATPVSLGRLTAGGEAGNGTLRQATEDLLQAQQKRLAALPQDVINLHRQQVRQARLFLSQANEAWSKLDVEGAKILATKAKVLLDELQA